MGYGVWDDASSHGIMHHEDGVHHEDACIPAAAHHVQQLGYMGYGVWSIIRTPHLVDGVS